LEIPDRLNSYFAIQKPQATPFFYLIKD